LPEKFRLNICQKPNVTQSRGDLIAIAAAALTKAIDGASRVSQFNGALHSFPSPRDLK
jgi:hypothetical protein